MIFIVGGTASGKSSFARENFLIKGYEIVDDFHKIVKENYLNNILSENNVADFFENYFIEKDLEKLVIISNELGAGIIPIEKSDRDFREINGKVNIHIASKSDEVYRMICGCATRIK